MILDSDYAVDILFTDVNLPGGMNGFALSRWARRNRPATRTIITSGLERAADEASDL
jgi:YesN/AraC family two-component response regulator